MNNSYREYEDYLEHYGIKGMRWGIRRYQNPDGTLTELGKKQYEKERSEEIELVNDHYNNVRNREIKRSVKSLKQLQKAKETGNNEKANKAMNEFTRAAIRNQTYKRLAEKEIEKISNTPISELSAERRSRETKALVTSLLTSAAVNAVMMPTVGYAMVYTARPDRSYLTDEERQQIIEETGGNYLTRSDKATISMNSRRYGRLKPRRKR